jgi:tetratricopeptide (TPR) repeat protein
MKPRIAILSILVLFLPAKAQTLAGDALPVGKVIPKVGTLHDETQTYALYLPATYSTEKKFPILYAFSPTGNGRHPVELFRKPAERFGWIVAGSNNSRNGPWAPIKAALEAIWKDTHARLAIDEKRMYATGFSGGAQAAIRLALAKKTFAGVLPCGASFPTGMGPGPGSTLLVCGMVGERCPSYPEMLGMDSALKALGIPHRLLVFDGAHAWPPPALAAEAVRFMELNHLCASGKAGEKWAEKLLDEELKVADDLTDKRSSLLEGYLRYKYWEPRFKGTSRREKLVERIAKTEARDDFKAEMAAQKALKEARAGLRKIKNDEEQFRQTLIRLKAFMDKHPGTSAAKRVKTQLDALPGRMVDGGYRLIRLKQYKHALTFLERALMIVPKEPEVHFLLAQVYAQTGEKAKACKCLDRAIALGLRVPRRVRDERLLKPLQEEQAYKDVIARIQKTAKESPDGKRPQK